MQMKSKRKTTATFQTYLGPLHGAKLGLSLVPDTLRVSGFLLHYPEVPFLLALLEMHCSASEILPQLQLVSGHGTRLKPSSLLEAFTDPFLWCSRHINTAPSSPYGHLGTW